MMKLQVMICTCGPSGLDSVAAMNLPQVEDVGYVVSCQSQAMPIPSALRRADIEVSFSPTKGLSNNRNAALSLVTAPYALVADDDLTFYPDALQSVIEAFDSHPQVDIAAFMLHLPYAKLYPAVEHPLWSPYKGYNPCSCEIAFRTASVRKAHLAFNPLLGIGAPVLGASEENVFLLKARRAGLQGRFFPVEVASHPQLTTSMHALLPKSVIMAQGAYIVLAYPCSGWLRLVLKAHRLQGSFFSNLRSLFAGAVYALRHRRELLS